MTPTSGIEFFVWLLIAAAIIAMFAKRLRIPYTASLVFGGLLLGISRIPILSPLQPGHRPDWLTPDVILALFLPALVFEGSVKLNVRELLRNSAPLLLLANAGMLFAALVTGYLVHWLEHRRRAGGGEHIRKGSRAGMYVDCGLALFSSSILSLLVLYRLR